MTAAIIGEKAANMLWSLEFQILSNERVWRRFFFTLFEELLTILKIISIYHKNNNTWCRENERVEKERASDYPWVTRIESTSFNILRLERERFKLNLWWHSINFTSTCTMHSGILLGKQFVRNYRVMPTLGQNIISILILIIKRHHLWGFLCACAS